MLKLKIGLLLLASALLFVSPSYADSFPTNLEVSAVGFCIPNATSYQFSQCIPITLQLNIAVEPLGFVDWLQVTNVTGTIDGTYVITSGTGAGLQPIQNDVPDFGGGDDGPILFQSLGDTWVIAQDQMLGPVAVWDENKGYGAWISWDVTPVFATPEPSSFAFLALGLFALAIYVLRRMGGIRVYFFTDN